MYSVVKRDFKGEQRQPAYAESLEGLEKPAYAESLEGLESPSFPEPSACVWNFVGNERL